MAKRPVFIAKEVYPYYEVIEVEFEFYPGFAITQKQKSISALHKSYKSLYPGLKVLEISTKSPSDLGVSLSAFNLPITTQGKVISLECAFQGGKRFEKGGPYIDIYDMKPWSAKKDSRLKESGELISFMFQDEVFSIEPKDFFYNWIYIKALCEYKDYLYKLQEYAAFTDIEFNPNKSINCQAKAIAIAVGLSKSGLLQDCIADKYKFLDVVYDRREFVTYEQMNLFQET